MVEGLPPEISKKALFQSFSLDLHIGIGYWILEDTGYWILEDTGYRILDTGKYWILDRYGTHGSFHNCINYIQIQI